MYSMDSSQMIAPTFLPSFTLTLLHLRADILARTEQTRKDYAAKKKEVLEKTQQVRTYIRELPTVGHFHA